MINFFRRGIMALSLGVTLCTFPGCDHTPQPATPKSTAEVQVNNGRLVFVNDAAFYHLRDGQLMSKNDAELDKWEQSHGFKSLRHVAASADAPQDVVGLRQSFMFPTAYATLINPQGEYQIGERIFWFHEGYKYEAHSEAELARIKQNPATATVKYEAGAHLIKREEGSMNRTAAPTPAAPSTDEPTTANTTVRVGDEYWGDRRYVQNPFRWDGKDRRMTIETFIYTEDVSGQFVYAAPCAAAPSGTYFTAVVLSIYREYYNRRWYRGGEELLISYNLNFWGSVNRDSNWEGPTCEPSYYYSNQPNQITASNISYSGGGNYTRDLRYDYVHRRTSGSSLNFLWTYDITGDVNVRFALSPGNAYIIGPGSLW